MSNLFRKSDEKQASSKNEPVIAMILLEDIMDLSCDKMLASYNEKNNDLINIQLKDNTITFELDNETGYISLMPGPVPWGDLEGPCAAAWYWKEAAQVLREHKAHILISILPQNEQKPMVERFISITKLVSSILQTSIALGVYWGSGTVVHSADNFLKRSSDINNKDIPYELWIEFRVEMFPDKKCNIITTGMRTFGHMEIEIVKSKNSPLNALEFVLNTINYLVKNGPVIKDGDTVGEDKTQKIKVKYKKSIRDRVGNVMSINY